MSRDARRITIVVLWLCGACLALSLGLIVADSWKHEWPVVGILGVASNAVALALNAFSMGRGDS